MPMDHLRVSHVAPMCAAPPHLRTVRARAVTAGALPIAVIPFGWPLSARAGLAASPLGILTRGRLPAALADAFGPAAAPPLVRPVFALARHRMRVLDEALLALAHAPPPTAATVATANATATGGSSGVGDGPAPAASVSSPLLFDPIAAAAAAGANASGRISPLPGAYGVGSTAQTPLISSERYGARVGGAPPLGALAAALPHARGLPAALLTAWAVQGGGAVASEVELRLHATLTHPLTGSPLALPPPSSPLPALAAALVAAAAPAHRQPRAPAAAGASSHSSAPPSASTASLATAPAAAGLPASGVPMGANLATDGSPPAAPGDGSGVGLARLAHAGNPWAAAEAARRATEEEEAEHTPAAAAEDPVRFGTAAAALLGLAVCAGARAPRGRGSPRENGGAGSDTAAPFDLRTV